MEAGDQEQEDEPTFCGNRGKRCRHIFGNCDYHIEMWDQIYHARIDRELMEEE
jgi:hypothetical protein